MHHQEELAVLKRQHVTRSLSFSADIFGGDVNDGSMADNDDNDANKRGSLKYLQIPNMQVSCLHEIFFFLCILWLLVLHGVCPSELDIF